VSESAPLAALERLLRKRAAKGMIGSPALEDAGKLSPAKVGLIACPCGKSGSQIKSCKRTDCMMQMKPVKALFVPISKVSQEEQTVTGIVLEPECCDAQEDIYSPDVVKKAAHNFLSNYNHSTKLGHQHKDFKSWRSRFALVESFLAPLDFVMNNRTVKQGSWVMTVKVLDSKIWKMVKAGQITGFSIGGRAKVEKLAED
jgi:hypothetical protein